MTQEPPVGVHSGRIRDKQTLLGAGVNPFNRDSADAQAAAIAKKYIPLFEKALHGMGIHMVTGVEIECSVDSNLRHLVSHFNEMKSKAESRFVPTYGSGCKDFANKVTRKLSGVELFVDSRNIRRGAIQHSYSDGGDLEVTTRPESPLRTAFWVQGIRKILVECNDEVADELASEGIKLGKHAQDIRDKGIAPKHLYFGAPANSSPYGEHINLSIHSVSKRRQDFSNFDLAAANLTKDRGWRDVLAYALAMHTTDDALALYGGPQTISRQAYQSAAIKIYEGGIEKTVPVTAYSQELVPNAVTDIIDKSPPTEKGEKLSQAECKRVEFRLPDSHSNIFLTTLVTMSAVYLAMKAAQEVFPKGFPKTLSDKDVGNVLSAMEALHSRSRILPHTVRDASLRMQTNSLISTMASDVAQHDKDMANKTRGNMAELRELLEKRAEAIDAERAADARTR